MTQRNSEPSVDELAGRAKEGDRMAFAGLVQSTQQRVFALAFRLLYDENDARDVAQESYIRVWEHFHRFKPDQLFEPWLLRIVTNLALDRLRARKRWWKIFQRADAIPEKEIPRATDLESQHSNAELAAAIRSISAQLPEKQRMVFILRDLQDCSVAEVAAITDMSPESVKTNLHYARKRICEILEKQYGVRKGNQ